MHGDRIPKVMLHYRPDGKRSLGRPKKRWIGNSTRSSSNASTVIFEQAHKFHTEANTSLRTDLKIDFTCKNRCMIHFLKMKSCDRHSGLISTSDVTLGFQLGIQFLRWMASFRITGSTLKKKSPGRNSIALRLSEATVKSRALRLLSLGPFEGNFVLLRTCQQVYSFTMPHLSTRNFVLVRTCQQNFVLVRICQQVYSFTMLHLFTYNFVLVRICQQNFVLVRICQQIIASLCCISLPRIRVGANMSTELRVRRTCQQVYSFTCCITFVLVRTCQQNFVLVRTCQQNFVLVRICQQVYSFTMLHFYLELRVGANMSTDYIKVNVDICFSEKNQYFRVCAQLTIYEARCIIYQRCRNQLESYCIFLIIVIVMNIVLRNTRTRQNQFGGGTVLNCSGNRNSLTGHCTQGHTAGFEPRKSYLPVYRAVSEQGSEISYKGRSVSFLPLLYLIEYLFREGDTGKVLSIHEHLGARPHSAVTTL
ncbi:hypothetical protein ANN_27346 [Periplaneta americana]|uniref:Uncharacterized protein n=1 Tax=Periplaneta americana TaxID=6978 RepID=A0ABQ8RY09_PERAM|nr:hypothetical protein ANN_27346 [Periplaneta americana]